MGILNFCKQCGARRVRDVKIQLEKLFTNKQITAHLCGICSSPLWVAESIKIQEERSGDTTHVSGGTVVSPVISDTEGEPTVPEKNSDDGCKEEKYSPQADKRLTRLSTGTIEPHHHEEMDLGDDIDNESIDVPFDSVMDSQDSNSDEGEDHSSKMLKVKKMKKSGSLSVRKGQKTGKKQKHKKKASQPHQEIEFELTKEQLEMRRSLDPKILAMMDMDDEKPTKTLKCKECKGSFRQLSGFMRHISTHTGGEFSVDKPYICQICDNRFARMTDFERHMARHTKQKSYVCQWDNCFATFGCKRYLTKHVRRHEGHKSYVYRGTGIKERKFACTAEGCKYMATTKDGLKVHQNTHTNARPYKCNYCDRRFNDPSSKRSHEGNKHSNSKDNHFMCELCGYSSYFKSDLMKHQRIHSGDKPFACNQCDYRCNRRDNLKKHLRIHSGDKTYKCFRCELVFPSLKACKNHEKTHSPRQPQPKVYQEGRGDAQTGKHFNRDENNFVHHETKKILPINDAHHSLDRNHPRTTDETLEMKPNPVACAYNAGHPGYNAGHPGFPALGEPSQQCQAQAPAPSQSEDWIRAVSFLQHLQQM